MQIKRLFQFATCLMVALFSLPVSAQQLVEPNRGGEVDLKSVDPLVAIQHLKLAPGYEVNLFASEQDFPIDNPVSMTWDPAGRLWVVTMPSYPHYVPGEAPNDKLVVLEDTDGDGKADKHTVFADKLYVPTGFELGDGGAYIAQQPDLIFVKDTDGDGVADLRQTVLHGFGSEDSHHSISAFTWGPGGALYMHEGTFHHTQVETPYGPVRLENAGVFRYEPKTFKLDVFVSYPFANPWGHIFDRWGQNFVADASGGSNYFGTAFSGHVDYPNKHSRMREFTETKVRPTAGCEMVRSRHFPDEAQGNFLLNNCIGFQGVKQHRMIEQGSGFTTKEVEPLIQSTDINFRPVDIQFGPDGALYLVDWFNPLIGHMQYSLRDENRDHSHGRIWRITYKDRPLLKPASMAGRPIPEILDRLKEYENRTRYRARTELRQRDPDQVTAALDTWLSMLDKNDENYEHHRLEALWVYQGIHVPQADLLMKLLRSPNPHARAAATRVLCYWRDEIANPLDLLHQQANDEHPRVRLEAVRACSFFASDRAAEVALEIQRHPTDYYLDYTFGETMKTLEPYWLPTIAAGKPFAVDNPVGIARILEKVPTNDLANIAPSRPLFEEMLARIGVRQDDRMLALQGLAKIDGNDILAQLLAAIRRADVRPPTDNTTPVILDLSRILTGQDPASLKPLFADFRSLAEGADRAVTRQMAYVAMVISDDNLTNTWKSATANASQLIDFLQAVPMIPDTELRNQLADRIGLLMLKEEGPVIKQLDINRPVMGRFVRIELPGKKRTLTLAEVEVISDGQNIAGQGKASQESTAFDGVAARAIDGNTSGRYGDGGQTHTKGDADSPWWELDLGSEFPIDSVRVWNRSENNGEYASRLDGFQLLVLDASRRPVFSKNKIAAPAKQDQYAVAGDQQQQIRRAAIAAMATIPVNADVTFRQLAKFVITNDQRQTSIRALQKMSRQNRSVDEIRPLVLSLVKYAQSVSAKERASDDIRNALQLAHELTAILPQGEAREARKMIGELGVRLVVIRTIPHKMRYDRTEFVVQAGKPVEVVLENTDIMPHNLLLTQQGKLQEVAQAAERMASQPNAFDKHFIPESPYILQSTKMLQSRESERLVFVAPSETGSYPFVCTFPGHWRTMNGIMHVVDDVEAFLEEHPLEEPAEIAEVRPFVRDWKIADLVSSLEQVSQNRSYENGKKMFVEASCITCHRIGEIGGFVGPELNKLDPKMTRTDILRELLEPSKVIRKEFRPHIIITDDGKQIIGLVQKRTDESITIMPNPLSTGQLNEKCEPIEIPLDEIDIEHVSEISLMPAGLMKTFNRDEILDLIAFIESRGDSKHELYKTRK